MSSKLFEGVNVKMNSRDSALRRYYRRIHNYLPCKGRQKHEILAEIQENIRRYTEEHPEADFSQIETHFGPPQSIAAAYVDDMNTEELLRALYIRKQITTILIIAVLTIVTLWSCIVSLAYFEAHSTINGYGQSYITDLSTEPSTD